MRSEMARPAASSFALLILKPEDKRSKEVLSELCELFRLRCADNEAMFELIICGIWVLLFNNYDLARLPVPLVFPAIQEGM